uniref:Tetraspanin-1 isoform X1 n=1 Tax=Hirondellea gigas TaxID=1518452 RepID=A0A2P2I445_9CRUS
MASLSCGAVFVKYILCLFNFAFFAAGGLILALSVWLAVDNTSFLLLTRLSTNPSLQVYNTPSVLEQGAYVMIAAGALIFLLGFLGCCGAAMESRSLLTTYGLLIIVLFVMQVAGGVLAAVYRTQAEDELEELLKFSLQKYYSTPQRANAVTLAWDAVMEELECCGVNNYTDFEKAALWQTNKTNKQLVPLACCAKTKVLRPTSASDMQILPQNDAPLPLLLHDAPLPLLLHDTGGLGQDFGGLQSVDGLQQNGFGGSQQQRDEPFALQQRQRNRHRNRQQQRALSCINNPTASNSFYLTGCYGRLRSWSRRNSSIIMYTAIALGIAQLLAILLAFTLCSTVGGDAK